MSAVAGRKPLHLARLEDDALVALARAGDPEAFEAIVNRYRAPLVNYCRRWVDPHRAEEVVQHTFMKAFLCLRDDERPLALRPWLYRVAHNAALNALEKKGSDWEELDENYDGVPQPPQVAEGRARFLRVVHEIEALPVRQREALLLNEFEGRCYADIAEELGTSESGVRGLLRRARRQLRQTAAALIPIPALLRAGPERAVQIDRAGDLIGSAGAVGGVGAAGGLAKVAAGVLAAGTIAGGGTAIERKHDAWRAPGAVAAPVPAAVAPAPAPRVGGLAVRRSSPPEGDRYAADRRTRELARIGGAPQLPREAVRPDGAVGGIEPRSLAVDPAPASPPAPAEGAPVLPVEPVEAPAEDGLSGAIGTGGEPEPPTGEPTTSDQPVTDDSGRTPPGTAPPATSTSTGSAGAAAS